LGRDPEYRARFLREARAEASLSHPSIATCFAVGEAPLDPPDLIPSDTPGAPSAPKLFLTMEYVPGSDLSAIVGGHPIPIPRVLDLTSQIAAGLEAAHAAGVVHRDLKPGNLRVTPDGRVKILDFGLAATLPRADRDTQSFVTSHDRVMGTCHFIAPEQAHGRTIDPRSDLFSLGVTLYLLVTGRLPFDGDSFVEVADSVAHTEPPPMARFANGVPDELERILRKLLAKDPDARYQSAHEVRTDLARLQEQPLPKPIRTGTRGRRARLLAFGSVVALIAGWWGWQHRMPPSWRTLAIVPFVNQTGDPRLDYIGSGLSADLTSLLIGGTHLNLAGASTVTAIEPARRTPTILAHELGADITLAGSLRKREDGLHLDLELVEGRRGLVVWAQDYDYELAGGEEVERRIVRDLRRRLSGSAGPSPKPAPASGKPAVASAYDGVLRAWSALDDPDDPHGPDRALSHVAKALEQDPDFALAWACRSRALWKLWRRDKSEESLRLAEEAANRALRLNPELLEARLARAQVYRATSRYADAIHELKDVLRVNPNWDEAELHLAATYRDAGALAQSEPHFRHVTQVRPGYWRNWNSLGDLLFFRGDYPGARQAYGKVIELVPNNDLGYARLAAVEILTGNYDLAIALYEKLQAPVQDGPTATNIGTAYFFARRLREARQFYELAVRLDPRNIVAWRNLGDLDERAGRPDSARVRYDQALRLADEQLHLDPRSPALHVQRILCLAKLGRCDEARTDLAAIPDSLIAESADLTHMLAKMHATCGQRAEAVAGARRAAKLGVSVALMRDEDEFAALVRDPGFPASSVRRMR